MLTTGDSAAAEATLAGAGEDGNDQSDSESASADPAQVASIEVVNPETGSTEDVSKPLEAPKGLEEKK